MAQRNLGSVNNLLDLADSGNVGDVITRVTPTEVGWQTLPGGGVDVSNAGVPVAGGPFSTLDALGGTFADEGGGVASYTPPSAASWILLVKPTDTSFPSGGATDPVLTIAATAGQLIRFRLSLFYTANVDACKIDLAYPAEDFLRNYLFGYDSGGNQQHTSNTATATPVTFTDFNSGEGRFYIEGAFHATADGAFTVALSTPLGASQNLLLRGSSLEYTVV